MDTAFLHLEHDYSIDDIGRHHINALWLSYGDDGAIVVSIESHVSDYFGKRRDELVAFALDDSMRQQVIDALANPLARQRATREEQGQ